MFNNSLPGEAFAPPGCFSRVLDLLSSLFSSDPRLCSGCFGDIEGKPCPGCGLVSPNTACGNYPNCEASQRSEARR